MRKFLRGKKGISLITLSITIVVLVILTNVVIYNVKDELGIERVRNMQNDIENLQDKIDNYYAQYRIIPIINQEYTETGVIEDSGLKSINDTGKFYPIDLKSLENLTLTYGEDYKKIGDSSTSKEISKLKDLYIINESSHNIFYMNGITFDEETYYTNYTKDEIDTENINRKIRYVDGIKIPDGYIYESGDNSTNLVITDGTTNYSWNQLNDSITELPMRCRPIDGNVEAAIESANIYGGYYMGPGYVIVYINSDAQGWSPTYDIASTYTDKNGDTVYIPAGFQVSREKGSDTVKSGLVARNASTDDRYVWVEVPKSIYKTVMSSDDYTNIEKDMRDYAKDFICNGTDSWYSGCGIQTSSEYDQLKNETLKNIYDRGGFWISQYEIGNSNGKPVSKEGEKAYTKIKCSDAYKKSSEMGNASLLFGVQWSLTLKFMETRGESTVDEILNSSSDWGNYKNSSFKVSRGAYSTDAGTAYTDISGTYYDKSANSSLLLTTGATNRNKKLNIYDLAGNVWEWSLLNSNNTNSPCTVLGGCFDNSSSTYNVKYAFGCSTTHANGYVGFRVFYK